MDEVWKNLSLSSLNHHPTVTTAAGSSGISASQPPISDLDFQRLLSSPLNQILPSEGDEQKSGTVSKPQIKRRALSGSCIAEHALDRKMIRLMKNRESAARSRARKQAYTYKLEIEVANLLKENALLKQQQEKVIGDERPRKHKLNRTLTAPF